jgi:uncharacterized delta-60 repeat protein
MNANYKSIITAISLLLALSVAISASPGDLDPDFGIGGRIYPLSGFPPLYSEGNDIVVQPDQKMVVSAWHYNSSSNIVGLLLSRYLPNGNLDPTFGVSGQVFNGDSGGGGKLALQSDGSILVAAGNHIFRYKTDGNLDTGFDGDGVLPFSAFSAYKLAVQNDGKIIVAGTKYIDPGNFGDPSLFGLVRLNSDGSFDTTFGSNGIVTTAFPYTSSYMGDIVIQADGKIVAAGSTSNFNGNGVCSSCNIALSRYYVDGSLDTSFGTSGRVVIPEVPYSYVYGSDVTLQADNKILVAGHYPNGGLVIRFMPDGLLDSSFGDAGQVSIPNLCPFSIAVQSNGKIVVAGGTFDYDPSISSHELGRLLSNGVLDPTFGINGRVTTVFPNLPQLGYMNGRVWGMAIQRDGKIVTAGTWSATDGDGNWYWTYAAIARYLSDPTPTCTNPIDCADFFVRQQYLDFLGREPDSNGFANWMATLTGCPNDGYGEFDNPYCDRVHVSAGFVQSNEFQGRGYWILRFGYVGLNRSIGALRSSATYAEFTPALAQVGGSNSPAQEDAAKVAYTNAFVQRPDFLELFPTSMTAAQYVNALESNAQVTLPNKQALIDALNGGTMNRADVLRNVVESQVIFDKYLIPAFVTMEYFGYLRRDPDLIGYQNWVNTLIADPNNYRHMIFGFIYSTEYRGRFGSP